MAEEYLEGKGLRGSGEKYREAVTQGAGDDELRGAMQGAYGAQPGAEVAPDQSRVEGGETLEEALGDETDLDVAVVGVELAADAAYPKKPITSRWRWMC